MILRWKTTTAFSILCLMAFIGLSFCSDSLAQEKVNPQPATQIAEDMQILSVIVRENMEALLNQHRPSEARKTDKSTSLQPARSTYLPDYGVVIHLQTPNLTVRTAAAESVHAKTASRWEQTRRRLKGQTECAQCHGGHVHKDFGAIQHQCAACHDVKKSPELKWWQGPHGFCPFFHGKKHPQPALTQNRLIDGLVDTLAENGHNVRGLAPDEKIALVVEYTPSAVDAHKWSFSEIRGYLSMQTISHQERMGDLFAKQGKYDQALEAYAKAWNESRSAQVQRKLADLYTKTGRSKSVPKDAPSPAKSGPKPASKSGPPSASKASLSQIHPVRITVWGIKAHLDDLAKKPRPAKSRQYIQVKVFDPNRGKQ